MSAADAIERAADRVPRAEAARIRRLADMLRRAPAGRQSAILSAIAVSAGRGTSADEASVVDATYPLYAGAPPSILARLLLGETPSAISRGLTRAEAHRWLSEMPTREPAEWLCHQHALDDHTPSTVAVARWIIAAWHDPPRREALVRDRTMAGPHGETIGGSYLSRADELRPGDLRPSIEATFRRASERLRREAERLLARKGLPLAPAPRWWRPVRCARLLLSGAELVAEGRVLGHCVGTYAPYVRRRESVIVSIVVLGHRSTVELALDGRVRQHKGPRNASPHVLCERALAVCLRRWGLAP